MVSPAQRALRRLISALYDDPTRASDAVRRALASAGRDTLSDDPHEILAFAKEHLADVIAADLGVERATTLLADFQEELAIPAAPAPTPQRASAPRVAARRVRASVLVLDEDRLTRAPLARALVRGGCDVSAADTAKDAVAALAGPDRIDVVLLDGDHAGFSATLKAIVAADARVALIARADRIAAANSRLLASGARDFAVRAKSATAEELLELIARFAE